jgi:hypothetical protein
MGSAHHPAADALVASAAKRASLDALRRATGTLVAFWKRVHECGLTGDRRR